MQIYFSSSKKVTILALGAESAGNFSVFYEKKIYFSENFGDLLEKNNWEKYKKKVLEYLKKNKIKPQIILTDLHPLFQTTLWGQELSQKYKARFIQIQHHYAHIFSAIGDRFINDSFYTLPKIFYGIACDGTGYGLDQKIWGGEIFKISENKTKKRIGHLENQILIGGDLAIREPARMLSAILAKFMKKKEIFNIVKKYYTQNEFELLYNQLKQNFNCLETSSAGRILDAISILLGFCKNERAYKHQPIELLEKNSTQAYSNLKPIIFKHFNPKSKTFYYELKTTALFEYMIKNFNLDKQRLGATAQKYLAQGIWKIIQLDNSSLSDFAIFFAGGIANNKIISSFLSSKKIYSAKKIPRGDAGISFGQVIYFLKFK